MSADVTPSAELDSRAVDHLSRIIRFPTVSARIGEPEVDAAFTDLFGTLPELYPSIWSTGMVTALPPWRLVIEIPGSNAGLDPLLLLAHFDVVDVAQSTESDWSHPPFSGHIDDEYVWGRGAIDDKSVVVALLEALERHVSSGTRLPRGVVLAFGGDEELSGRRGAGTTAGEFAEAGRQFHAVIDEGGVIASGMLRTPAAPVALIGIAEKGFCNIRISATASGGHASMPPKGTAVGSVARAAVRIEASPFRARLLPGIRRFFATLGRWAGMPERLLFSHVRAVWPLLARVLRKTPSTNALIRTTQAVTMASGSSAANVLPQEATLTVNCRILPGESVSSVLEHYRKLLDGLPVTVALSDGDEHSEPVGESPVDHPTYQRIERLVAERFPHAIAAPYLVTGSTDSKWYRDLTECIIRFVPITLEPHDLARVHGTDERISTRAYIDLIAFYEQLIEQECGNG